MVLVLFKQDAFLHHTTHIIQKNRGSNTEKKTSKKSTAQLGYAIKILDLAISDKSERVNFRTINMKDSVASKHCPTNNRCGYTVIAYHLSCISLL